MNIENNPAAMQCIISLALAGTCPIDQRDKLKELKEWADEAKDHLLIEVQDFLIGEANKLANDEEEFDRYYEKAMDRIKAHQMLNKTD